MSLKALFLNCTLKKSPEVSHTRALIDKAVELFQDLGVDSEVVRIVDHNIAFGVSSDEGGDDEWPQILEKIKACDILVIGSSIWFGVRSAVAQMVLERLDGSYADADPETGQYPLYGKVAGVIVTGNEDGAHNVSANTLFNLTHLGCTIPPNADCYWVGDKKRRHNHSSWAFRQLQTFIEYKAKEVGIITHYVDPSYTSQTCIRCNHISKNNRNRLSFRCEKCGYANNADLIGAMNIEHKTRDYRYILESQGCLSATQTNA
ncbi:zinc ribbon domain-containing protein [Methanohalophilus profundi]|uniref:zinc ribbon domain-containing protein n=1 Tax=Methanohalophilus profundi TaxID=2138083 RepID=UPI001CDD3FFA|nr:zinc ribbon domain-containing protein [Methanohalophilus profundi]